MEELLTEFNIFELWISMVVFGGMLFIGGSLAAMLGGLIFFVFVELPIIIIKGIYFGIRCINKEYRENFMKKFKEHDDGTT